MNSTMNQHNDISRELYRMPKNLPKLSTWQLNVTIPPTCFLYVFDCEIKYGPPLVDIPWQRPEQEKGGKIINMRFKIICVNRIFIVVQV